MRSAAFDKTGTLTDGKLSVDSITSFADADGRRILQLAASLEKQSRHPIANAVVKSAEEKGVPFLSVDEFVSVPGKGARGRVEGMEILVGNQALFEEYGFPNDQISRALDSPEQRSKTVVMVGTTGQLLGSIFISDRLRPESKSAITDLRSQGVAHTILITGDNAHTAGSTGEEAGIDEIRAELLPDQKVEAIEELKARYGSVAMIGDGVNDAPALAAADIGIAMGAIGSDVALETADIALMSDDLSRIPWAFRLSQKAYRIIIANITAAIGIKAIFIGLASSGLATLWMAVFADMGVSLLVIINGMRALRSR
jgi:Cd2+/Zn2+-exporting ATPase